MRYADFLVDSLAERAYNAYIEEIEKIGCNNYFGFEKPKRFFELTETIKNAWKTVVRRILEQ